MLKSKDGLNDASETRCSLSVANIGFDLRSISDERNDMVIS